MQNVEHCTRCRLKLRCEAASGLLIKHSISSLTKFEILREASKNITS
ncbi:hypothetical protein HMPREF1325_1207 [Treponema socranskii subsp. socranskii VPI DR56BR1116 = ATCC 35536]|uniref:Uncharacterized protein n=1 Tax=Treponema socranskii subsp. socranskii VPI DR56BR1116 = ATCC 35536 TaxID=1125725 RepID=U1FA73_TRESO|nr:hypothetical protein HMPREF1325_1207 [Treponema socranskii subsp. socranskii VPI DR56BR1116 = ATCC 35536]